MKKFNLLSLIALLFAGVSLQAQYDDLYIIDTPADDVITSTYSESQDADVSYDDAEYASYDNDGYDDYDESYDEYEYYSEYDNYYSNRINRFRRASAGNNYYNSYYSNDVLYDPFYSYYSPQAYSYSRLNRGFYPVNRGGLISVVFGSPAYYGGSYYNPYLRNRRFNNFGSFGRVGGFAGGGGFAGSGGYAAGCPVGGFPATGRSIGVSNQRTSTGSRRGGSARTATSTRNSRVQTYGSGAGSRTAPRTTSTSRGSATAPRTSSSSRATSRRSSKGSSTKSQPRSTSRSTSKSYKSRSSSSSKSRSYRPSRSSSRSSGTRSSSRSSSRSSGSSRRGR